MEAALIFHAFYCASAELGDAIAPSAFFPPNLGIFGPIQHLRQFFFDFGQAVGAHFQRGVINLGVRGLLCGQLVHMA